MNQTLVLPSAVGRPPSPADYFGPEAVIHDVVWGARLAATGVAASSALLGSAKGWRRALLAQSVRQPGPALLGFGLVLVAGSAPNKLRRPSTLLGGIATRTFSLSVCALGIALVAAGTLLLVLRHPRLLIVL
jgi:hypothetical protein